MKRKIKWNNNAAYYKATAVKKLHLDPRQGLKTKGVSVFRQTAVERLRHISAGLYRVGKSRKVERERGSIHNGAPGYTILRLTTQQRLSHNNRIASWLLFVCTQNLRNCIICPGDPWTPSQWDFERCFGCPLWACFLRLKEQIETKD